MSSPVAVVSETDRLDPIPTTLTLSSGMKVEVQRLKLRQLFRLLRIITRGGAGYLPMLREAFLEANDDDRSEAVGVQLMAIAVIALPEAEDEAVEFLRSVVEPADLPAGADKLTKASRDTMYAELNQQLFNPEIEDALTIIEAVIEREKGDLAALGKRLGTALQMMGKTGQLDEKKPQPSRLESPTISTVQIPDSLDPSDESATSSPVNMVGPTKSSSTPVSAEFGK